MTWRLRVLGVLVVPAEAWMWLCARLVGGRFTCGPVHDDDAK